jgi:hypothetical protein
VSCIVQPLSSSSRIRIRRHRRIDRRFRPALIAASARRSSSLRLSPGNRSTDFFFGRFTHRYRSFLDPERKSDPHVPAEALAWLVLTVVADAFAHRGAFGFPTHVIRVDPVYDAIARMPGDFVLLEVPLGVRCGTDVIGRGDDFMLFQTVHGKRMINGYPSRVPLVALAYYRKSPAFMFLAGEQPPAGDIAADLDARLRELNVGVIVVHPGELPAERLTAILALLRQRQDLEPIAVAGTATLAFRVKR